TVYGLDGCITILLRLSRRENIFLPHRTHLYQYLANELKFPHVVISLVYALIQLGINLTLIYLVDIGQLQYMEGLWFIVFSVLAYIIFRKIVLSAILRPLG